MNHVSQASATCASQLPNTVVSNSQRAPAPGARPAPLGVRFQRDPSLHRNSLLRSLPFSGLDFHTNKNKKPACTFCHFVSTADHQPFGMAMSTRSIDDLESVLTSRVITFLIGPEKKAFHINEKLVTCCSDIFRKMFTNGMRESHEGVVELDEHEPRVFTSFINYILYGNYQVPVPKGNSEHTADDTGKEVPVVPDGDYDSLSDHVLKQTALLANPSKPPPYVEYMESFVHQGDTGKTYGKPPGLPSNESPDLEANFDLLVANSQFGEICAHHVKLYIFADKYDVAELRQLCLHRLHCSLVRAKLSDTGYQFLFDAIAFAFENTCPGDKIRRLFVQMCVADFSLVRIMAGYKDLCFRVPEVVYELTMELPKYWDTARNASLDVASKFLNE